MEEGKEYPRKGQMAFPEIDSTPQPQKPQFSVVRPSQPAESFQPKMTEKPPRSIRYLQPGDLVKIKNKSPHGKSFLYAQVLYPYGYNRDSFTRIGDQKRGKKSFEVQEGVLVVRTLTKPQYEFQRDLLKKGEPPKEFHVEDRDRRALHSGDRFQILGQIRRRDLIHKPKAASQ